MTSMPPSTLIVNARLVNEGRESDGDLRFSDGFIGEIGSGLSAQRSDVLGKCGWSPFEGTTFHARIAATWLNGLLAWDGSALVGDAAGQRLQFNR